MGTSRLFRIVIVLGLWVGLQLPAENMAAATTFPGKNGAIAYTRGSEGARTIWIVGASGKHRLVADKDAHSPRWSPDGKKLVFVEGNQLCIVYSSGKKGVVTRAVEGRISSPVWSGDGSSIAFVREKGSADNLRSAVFIIRSGSHERNISGWSPTENFRSPSWSPDGKEIVYEGYDTTSARLIIKNIATRHVRGLTSLSDKTDSANVQWSPSGKKLLFRDSLREFYTIYPDGSHRTVISDGDSYHASWSPSGKRILFLEDPHDSSLTISEESGAMTYVPIEKADSQFLGVRVWSPDERRLLLTITDKGYDAKLFSLDLASEKLTSLASGVNEASWQAVSPKNNQVSH